MMIHRHPSFFPVVLVVLTLVLGGFMFASFRARPAVSLSSTSVVSETEYRAAVKEALGPVIVPAKSDRAAAVNRALSALLALRVPSQEMESHLAFARALSRLQEGLKGNADALRDGQTQFDAAVAANPWVR